MLEIAIMEDSHISNNVTTWFTEGPNLLSEIGPPIMNGSIRSALEWDGMLLPEHPSYQQVLQNSTHLWLIDIKGTDSFLGPTEEGQHKRYQLLSGHRNTGQNLDCNVGMEIFPTTQLLRTKFGTAGAAEQRPSTRA